MNGQAVLLLLFYIFWTVKAAEGCTSRKLKFDPDPMKGKRLFNHLIDSKKAESVTWCRWFCLWDNNCVSVNFNDTEDSDKQHLCELNNSDKEQHSDDLKNETDFSHHATKNPCTNSSCGVNGLCQTGFGCEGYRCVCKAGYSGQACEKDLNECDKSKPCHPNAKCINTPGSYECKCNAGYEGNGKQCADIDECSPNPCSNDGTCTNLISDFNCSCVAGYTGKNCSTNTDECFPNPCSNGGTCTDLINDFNCSCVAGYFGKNCSTSLPTFTLKPPENATHGRGETLTLNCSAVGDLQPVMSWRKDGGQLPRDRTTVTNGLLRIRNLQHQDAGEYVCTATSAAIPDVQARTRVRISDMRIRLTHGSYGLVEVFVNGTWGTVCDDGFENDAASSLEKNMNAANVVCRQLGYSGATSYHCCAHFGKGSGDILMDEVRCTGSESSIHDCAHNVYGVHNCGHHEDVGVRCST